MNYEEYMPSVKWIPCDYSDGNRHQDRICAIGDRAIVVPYDLSEQARQSYVNSIIDACRKEELKIEEKQKQDEEDRINAIIKEIEEDYKTHGMIDIEL